ncbi:hypothetical protein VPH35_002975 [Triticum aestivum]
MVRNLLEKESLHRRQDHLQLLHLHARSRRPLVRACPSIPPVPHPRQGLLQPQRHGNFVFSPLSLCFLPVHSIGPGCWYLRDRQNLVMAIRNLEWRLPILGVFVGMRYYFLICGWLMEPVYSQSFGIEILVVLSNGFHIIPWKVTTEDKVCDLYVLLMTDFQ